MIRIALATNVIVLGLQGARDSNDASIGLALRIDGERHSRRGLRLTLSIGSDGRERLLSRGLRLVFQGIRSLGQGADEQVVGINLHLSYLAGLGRSLDGDCRLIANGHGSRRATHGAGHGVVGLVATEGDITDIETSLVGIQAEGVATGCQLLLENAMHRHEVVVSACGRHLQDTGVEGQVVETIFRDMEGTTRIGSSHLGIKLIDARFLHVNGILHPTISLRG